MNVSGSARSLAKKKLPSYLLHKPTGQACVRINGRDHYLGELDELLRDSRRDALKSVAMNNEQIEPTDGRHSQFRTVRAD